MSQRVAVRRRELLQSLGAASFLAVPILTMREARAATPVAKRLVVFFFPGGVYGGPEGNDDYVTYDRMLAPLADLKDEILIVKKLANKASVNKM